MIYGNTDGIRNSILDKLERVYNLKMPHNVLCSMELMEMLCEVTDFLNREICVSVDRKGSVLQVCVGDSSTVQIDTSISREGKLSRVRIIHTHPNGNSKFSKLDMSVLLKMKLDCIAAVGVCGGSPTSVSLGFCGMSNGKLLPEVMEELTLEDALNYNISDKIHLMETFIEDREEEQNKGERAIIAGIDTEDSLDELERLAEACDVDVVSRIFQKRIVQDSVFYVGKGKVEEISFAAQLNDADLVIFDDELSGSQISNIENMIGIKTIDRTTLILDIFARRARSREAKIQVELAQLKYRLARLSGMGESLSRTGGGIGTRGPGEKKLETDRRRIRDRISDMSHELKKIAKTREVQRQNRKEIPKVSLVGYTNAGKSTLRNLLCDMASFKEGAEKKKVLEADMLFATLDTTTRALRLNDGRVITLTDTVGFVKKLPHELIEAFKSTLEEVIYSDLLLHVVDASSEDAIGQIDAVNNVLLQLGVKDKPILMVLNKIDRVFEDNINKIRQRYNESNIICVSAREQINIEVLIDNMSSLIENNDIEAEFLVPYTEQEVAAYIYRRSKVKETKFSEDGTYICALVDKETYNKCKKFVQDK